MWSTHICDTMTGRIITPISIPSFSWTVSVSDSAMSTTKDKGVGETSIGSISVPWTAINATTPTERRQLLAPSKRSVALFWREPGTNGLGTPIVCGPIGERTDSQNSTSFPLGSILTMLADRYLVDENTFGADRNTTSSVIEYRNRSFRAIAADVGKRCTSMKPGGALPIDWQYDDEPGTHDRTYEGFNVANLSCADIYTKLANVIGGPDLQFRPYLTDDGSSVRYKFLAGSDADIYLHQQTVHRLVYTAHGASTLENLTIDSAPAIHRIYGTGSGDENAQWDYLAEDLNLVQREDGWPLVETTYNDSDANSIQLLKAHTDAQLDAQRLPLMQFKAEMHANDTATNGQPLNPLGSIWPGETVQLDIQGFPTLEDNIYTCRLMEISGDQTDKINMIFDPITDPMIRNR